MKITRIEIGKYGYVTSEVSSVDVDKFNYNIENRIKSVTDIAAISRGNLKSSNPNMRFGLLLKEAAYNYSIEDLNEFDRDVLPEEDERLINTVGRPLEFCPVVLRFSYAIDYTNDSSKGEKCYILETLEGETLLTLRNYIDIFPLLRFSYFDRKKHIIYTTYRAYYNFLINYLRIYNGPDYVTADINRIPFLTNSKYASKYRVLRIKAPMFVWAQLMTHTQLSKISQSDRVSTQNDYWLPDNIFSRIRNIEISKLDQESDKNLVTKVKELKINLKLHWNDMTKDVDKAYALVLDYFLNRLPQSYVQNLLKFLGYKKEIYSRAPYYFKYKVFIMGGWINDPYGWGHLLLERDGFENIRKSWTQKETKEYAVAIKKMLSQKDS